MTPTDRLTALETWRQEFALRHRQEREQQQQTNLDVEQRMRRLERALYICTGLGMALQVGIRIFVK